MNSKPTILYDEKNYIHLASPQYDKLGIVTEYFDIQPYKEDNCNYNPSSTIFLIERLDYIDYAFGKLQTIYPSLSERPTPLTSEYIQKLRDKGFKIVIDQCADRWDSRWDNREDFTLRPKHFDWFDESLCWRAEGYHNIEFESAPEYSFLMLMNMQRKHRDNLYEKLLPVLDNSIHSYVEKGVPITNSTDVDTRNDRWMRYINPDWYNKTKFSVVAETIFYYYGCDFHPGKHSFAYDETGKTYIPDLCISEKSFKPIAFGHPFITLGEPGTLKMLQDFGFETFDNCVDESYDLLTDDDLRLINVVEQIRLAVETDFDTPIVKEKIAHNRNRFWDYSLVKNLFKEEVVNPLLELIE